MVIPFFFTVCCLNHFGTVFLPFWGCHWGTVFLQFLNSPPETPRTQIFQIWQALPNPFENPSKSALSGQFLSLAPPAGLTNGHKWPFQPDRLFTVFSSSPRYRLFTVFFARGGSKMLFKKQCKNT